MRAYVLALLASGACVVDGDPVVTNSQDHPLSVSDACHVFHLEWGADAHSVGRIGPAEEFAARGPSDVAVRPDGSLLILDPINSRVVAMDSAGHLSVVAQVPEHAEDLAVGRDGSIAVHSPLAATVWLYTASGRELGSIAIPRELRNVVDISVGQSRSIIAHTALQESFVLGSPSAVADSASLFANKREAAYVVDARTGVQSYLRRDGSAVMRVTTASDRVGDKGRYRDVSLADHADSALVIGSQGSTACFRLEQVDRASSTVSVTRRLRCLDIDSGETLFQEDSRVPSLYVPRHEVVFEKHRLVSLRPEDTAFHVETCEVTR